MTRHKSQLPIDRLSVRAQNILARLRIRRPEDLEKISENILLRTNSCGKKTAAEILTWAETVELNTPDSPDDQNGASLDQILPMSQLSVRARNTLKRLGIRTKGDLRAVNAANFAATKNCGTKTVDEIVSWAYSNRLSLAPVIDENGEGYHQPPIEGCPLTLLLKPSDLGLSVRAQHCLTQHGVMYVGDLAILNEPEIRKWRQCGTATISEYKSLLHKLNLRMGSLIPDWPHCDPAKLTRANARKIADLRRRYQDDHFQIDSTNGLRHEITSALAAVARPDDAIRIELWLSLDQKFPATLEDVAQAANVTRERIRQVVDRGQRGIKGSKLTMPCLRHAVRLLEKQELALDSSALNCLKAEGILRGDLSIVGIVRAAGLFGIRTKLDTVVFNTHHFVGLQQRLEDLNSLRRTATSEIRRYGCAQLDRFCEKASALLRRQLSTSFVLDVLQTESGFHWLHKSTGWFTLNGVGKNPVLNTVNKVLAVTPRVDLAALRGSIARRPRMEGFAPPTRVLKAICTNIPGCEVLDGRFIIDKRNKGDKSLTTNERKIVRIFRNNGPVLSLGRALELCLEAGMSEITARIYIYNNPIVRRIAPQAYTLIGDEVSKGDVESATGDNLREKRARTVLDYGWSSDGGGIWIDYHISRGMIRSGIVSIPSAMRNFIEDGCYALVDLRGNNYRQTKINKCSIWGIGAVYPAFNCESGDYLRIEIQTPCRTIIAQISPEPFSDL